MFVPDQIVMVSCKHATVMQQRIQFFLQDGMNQGTFPGARRTSDANKFLQRYLNINVLQVIVPGAANCQAVTAACPTLFGNLDPATADLVFVELVNLLRQEGVAALIATHNMELARGMDRVDKIGRHIFYFEERY